MADTSPLPLDVAATIRALLPPGTPGREELLHQLPHTTAGKRCACGCASVDLIVDRSAATPAHVPQYPAAEATVLGPDGSEAGGIILFTMDGYLSYLEIYTFLDNPMTTWPPPALLDLGTG